MYVWICRSILNKLYTVTAPIVNEALWVGAHTAYLFSPNSVCNLLQSVDLPLPPIPRIQQPLFSSESLDNHWSVVCYTNSTTSNGRGITNNKPYVESSTAPTGAGGFDQQISLQAAQNTNTVQHYNIKLQDMLIYKVELIIMFLGQF